MIHFSDLENRKDDYFTEMFKDDDDDLYEETENNL